MAQTKKTDDNFKRFTLYIEPELLEACKAQAVRERRSISSLFSVAAVAYLQQQGVDVSPFQPS